ncbi:FAD-binding oxidoreductase [Nitratireductor sp. ZSWI3]|uniref:FAD-binding oxidoreductase n=1 Tax=Nitratireductor sp. ZSWI3 TaxID=2966359 RepID=UPI00214F80E1|nr:FAD-binding oxidoreductase [Nitratireductor sp. ZSWI3]MCR4267210.1 FAD-binding oxidoreductase [Nitratireductor sp. ZSWI3]
MSEILQRLGTILGEKGLIADPAEMAPFVTDFRGRWKGEAVAVALPASTQQAAETIRLAAAHDLPIYPLGGNTGLCYGAVPAGGSGRKAGIVVGLARMNALRSVDRAANVMTVDAGMTLSAVHEIAAGEGRQFPLYLGSEGTAQIGGLISTNAGGTGVVRYGPMRDLVCGIEAVLPDGRILRDLNALKKNNTGYDLKQLFIGGEGTLGLVTGAALRMRPAIHARAHAWVSVTGPEAAVDLLSRLQDRCGETIEAFEMLNRAEVDCVLAHIPRVRTPFATTPDWSVMIELADADPAAELLPALEEVLGAAIEAGLADDAMIAQNEAQARDIWHVRHSVTEAHKIHGIGVVHDTAVPVSKVPAFIAAADAMTEELFPEAGRLVVAHLGDGNVHYIVMFTHAYWQALADKEAKALEVEMAVHDIADRFGGTISAEHGIGRKLTSELERLGDPVKIALMRDIKTVLDPKNIMNPGALIP